MWERSPPPISKGRLSCEYARERDIMSANLKCALNPHILRARRKALSRRLDHGPDRSCLPVASQEELTFAPRACFNQSFERVRAGRSPPARGRGSKHQEAALLVVGPRSPPARGRGSKHEEGMFLAHLERRPQRGGVDRNTVILRSYQQDCRRPLRGGVDRNDVKNLAVNQGLSRPLRRAWIETPIRSARPRSG